MRLSLRDLEEARCDPAAYRTRARTGSGVFLRMSRARALHLAAFEFHRRGENHAGAAQYLDSLYHRHFKRPELLGALDDQLTDYVMGYRSNGYAAFEFQTRVSIPVDGELQLSGEVPRADLAPNGGYAVWLFGKAPYLWRSELRMPLLQSAYAEKMMTTYEQVRVGFYFFETATYESTCYAAAELLEARREAEMLSRELVSPGT
jgi:hypothetical protein